MAFPSSLLRDKIKTWFFPAITVLLSVGLMELNLPHPDEISNYETRLEATVIDSQTYEESSFEGNQTIQDLTLQIKDPHFKEPIHITEESGRSLDARFFEVGDEVLVVQVHAPDSKPTYFIADHIRRDVLYSLFGAFLLIVLVVAGEQGSRAFLGMIFSFVVIVKWTLPLLLSGTDPLLASMSGALVIIPVTYGLSHGFEKKTGLAITGTLIALFLSGIAAKWSIEWAKLTGLADESALYLESTLQIPIDFQALLLAGVLISLLGVLDDVTIAQTSVIQELVEAKPHIRFSELYRRAMQVGKDHITSMVNTMVLIYAGASLPLLLVFMTGGRNFNEVINYEFIAQQLIQTLIGSTGILLAVPLTTLLAAFFLQNKRKKLE